MSVDTRQRPALHLAEPEDDLASLLTVDAIDVYYGAVQALRQLSLQVRAGEMVALVGSNGAGKSTTLRAISGLLAPRSGSITLDGDRIDGRPAYRVIGRGVAHLPEGRDLFPGLTVLENLRLGHWVQRRNKAGLHARVSEVMDFFPRLRERSGQAAGTLSGGEQQMLGVARALMSTPRLLLVDELSLGLAPIVVEQLFGILTSVREAGTAILIVEQFVHMALEFSNRAYVLSRGQVVLSDKSADLRNHPDLAATYLGHGAGTHG
jgi:branched-chain amino acid transport system ATP-binding protein